MNQTIRIVPECGHGFAGHWGDKEDENKGAICWKFEKGSPPIAVLWPAELFCRYCNKVFTREEVQKHWLIPVYYDDNDNTFNCGCFAIDSSD